MSNSTDKIDLNNADLEVLTTLPGIGSALAKRIIEYRETVHPFEEVIELTAVPGISERLVRSFSDKVAVFGTQEEEEVTAEIPFAEPIYAGTEGPNAEAEEVDASPKQDESGEVAETPEEAATEPAEEIESPQIVGELEQASDEDSEVEVAEPATPPAAPERSAISEGLTALAEAEQRAQRRGCFALVVGGLLGAVVGTVLTLAILAALNEGTLSFTQADTQLRRDIEDAGQTQADLRDRLDALDVQLIESENQAAMLEQQQTETDRTLETVRQTLNAVQDEVNALEETTGEMDERISRLASAAETFDVFLDSLRDLLIDLQGPPPTPIPTVTSTATPVATSVTPTAESETATPAASPTVAGPATRTPRPTATPFALPSSTPEPQP